MGLVRLAAQAVRRLRALVPPKRLVEQVAAMVVLAAVAVPAVLPLPAARVVCLTLQLPVTAKAAAALQMD